jgi:hypothetical protein
LKTRAVTMGLVALVLVGGATSYFTGYQFGTTSKSQAVAPPPDIESPLVRREKTVDGRDVVEGGTLQNPQGVDNPGDPQHAIEDFKRIYLYLDGYRKEVGRLPTADEFLERRALKNGLQLTEDDLKNPDWTIADGMDAIQRIDRKCHYTVSFDSPRPDGTPKPAFPKDGERDLWMLSQLTARSNTILYPGGRQKSHFTGYFVSLFSDGSIEMFRHKEMLFVARPGEPRMPYLTTPGVAGLPEKVTPWPDHVAFRPRENYEVSFEE